MNPAREFIGCTSEVSLVQIDQEVRVQELDSTDIVDEISDGINLILIQFDIDVLHNNIKALLHPCNQRRDGISLCDRVTFLHDATVREERSSEPDSPLPATILVGYGSKAFFLLGVSNGCI